MQLGISATRPKFYPITVSVLVVELVVDQFSVNVQHPRFTLFPYTTLFRSCRGAADDHLQRSDDRAHERRGHSVDSHPVRAHRRSEEHTSELQSLRHLVCRLLLEKKNLLYEQKDCTMACRRWVLRRPTAPYT